MIYRHVIANYSILTWSLKSILWKQDQILCKYYMNNKYIFFLNSGMCSLFIFSVYLSFETILWSSQGSFYYAFLLLLDFSPEHLWTFWRISGQKYVCVRLLFFFCIVTILWFVYFISSYNEPTLSILFLFFSIVLHFIFIQNQTCHFMLVVDAPLKMKRVTKSSISESILKVIRLNPLSAFAAF